MFFRNLTLYRFPQSFGGLFPSAVADELGELHTALDQCRLRPVGPMELASRGFVSPFGRGSEQLTQTVGRATWFTLGGEDKILPAAVVNDLLAKKVAEIEEREGRSPLGRARKRLKEELVAELLPRAFVKPGRCDAYFDFDRCLLLVDTSSRNRADQVVGELRRAIGSFPALPLNAEVAPRAVLTGWVAGEALPEGLSLGEECELRGANDERVVIRNLDLQSEEVATHLEAGMQCTRLALVLDDRVSFVFGEDLVVRKLKFLGGAVDALEGQEHEDARAELDARFALQVGELGRLFDLLEAAFRISPAEDDGAPRPVLKRAARKAWDKLKSMGGEDGGRVTISDGDGQILLDSADPAKGGYPDPLYAQARDVVLESGSATISRVQRVLKIGYNRAARLIEAMEAAGEVSRPDAQGKRQILSRSLQ